MAKFKMTPEELKIKSKKIAEAMVNRLNYHVINGKDNKDNKNNKSKN